MQTDADTFLLQLFSLLSLRTHQMVGYASAVFISGIAHLKYALKVMLRRVVPVFQQTTMEVRCKLQYADFVMHAAHD